MPGGAGRRRRRYHRRQERGDEHAQEQRDAEDRADVVDSEVRLHAGVALSPEYPERGLGDAEDDDRDEVEACGQRDGREKIPGPPCPKKPAIIAAGKTIGWSLK